MLNKAIKPFKTDMEVLKGLFTDKSKCMKCQIININYKVSFGCKECNILLKEKYSKGMIRC